ncbi:hypothetical protein [Psychrobacillus sp. L3]|uniref:hypothetical protein n=1 Tax=Psychrobacillus sp. L3 TaxID=3236891 RepID=UPI0036F1F3BF
MKKYQTLSESMRESMIELDAMERKALAGFIFVDLSAEGGVTAAYFEDKSGKVHSLDLASKLQVITTDENGVNYHDINGQDIFNRKNDSGGPLFAGMAALYFGSN